MTRKEFAVFVDMTKAAFPRDNLLAMPEQVTLWYELLGDLSPQSAVMALKKYMLINKFPPTVADIRGLATDLVAQHIPDADEAWGEVTKAIRRYGYPREREALDSMSETVRKTVERIGFQNICLSQYDQFNTLRAQFKGFYEAEYRRSMEVHKMPNSMRLEQAKMQQGALPMKEGADGRSEST